MTIRTVAVAATSLTAALVLAGCGAGSGTTGSAGTPQAPPAAAQTAHNAADVAFAQGMIPHHAQAVRMSELAATRASAPEVRTLAAEIGRAQAPEIEQMRGFLTAWGAPEAPAGHDGAAHGAGQGGMAGMTGPAGMPGMVDDGGMDRLAAASGPEFDRLFLQLMTAHHRGAVQMAGTELATGADPRATALARSITDTQRAELDRMQALLR